MTNPIINKTMDRADLERPECRLVLMELFGLMRRMNAKGARYSSWYGRATGWPSPWESINRGESYEPWPANPDELHVPWFLLWEIAWLVVNTPLVPGGRVLDMGGAGSLFSCYLASRGHDVVSIDLEPTLCDLANETGQRMGWRLHGEQMDMTQLAFPEASFDHVFSVCVLEHLPISGRIRCGAQVASLLKPGGTASYTFDYANPQAFGRLGSPDDVHSQLVTPSRLTLRGNKRFQDSGGRYLATPQCFGFSRISRLAAGVHAALTRQLPWRNIISRKTSYTFGAIFLEK